MKKLLAAFLAITLALGSGAVSSVFAAEEQNKSELYTIEDRALHSTMNTITGTLPTLAGSDKEFDKKVNDVIDGFFDEIMQSANPGEAPYPPVNFAYETFGNEKYFSIVMFGSVNHLNTGSTVVKTIVLDQKADKLYALTDILGAKAYEIAGRFIDDAIAKNPDNFLGESLRLEIVPDENTPFYMDDSSDLVFVFDKYQITPGSQGTPRLVFPLKNFLHIGLPLENSYTNDKTIMLPLRKVLEMFQVPFYWSSSENAVIMPEGGYKLKAGVNDYKGKALACAPEIKADRMYVPMEFITEYCGISGAIGSEVIELAKLIQPEILKISGTIKDASMNTITIETDNEVTIAFSTMDADKSECNGLIIGSKVVIYYSGQITGADASKAKVICLKQPE